MPSRKGYLVGRGMGKATLSREDEAKERRRD